MTIPSPAPSEPEIINQGPPFTDTCGTNTSVAPIIMDRMNIHKYCPETMLRTCSDFRKTIPNVKLKLRTNRYNDGM
jgi:hypothetical protein